MVAEVAELPHGTAQLVDAGGAHRLLAEAHLLRSQRDPDALTDAEVSRVIDHELPADLGAMHRDQARVAGTHRAFEEVGGAHEVRDETASRELIDLRRRPDLHDLAAVHDRDARRERHRFVLVVGHDDEGDADLMLQIHELELGLLAQFLVQRRQRLIEQQHLRAAHQRPRQRHALPLAAGELVRLALCQPPELHHFKRLLDAGAFCLLVERQPAQAVADIVLHRHVRKQCVGLEHHVDRPLVRRHAAHIYAIDADTAAARVRESRQHPQQRGLAATRSADQREHLALVDLERDVIDRRVGVVGLADAVDEDLRRRPRIEPRGVGERFRLGHHHGRCAPVRNPPAAWRAAAAGHRRAARPRAPAPCGAPTRAHDSGKSPPTPWSRWQYGVPAP